MSASNVTPIHPPSASPESSSDTNRSIHLRAVRTDSTDTDSGEILALDERLAVIAIALLAAAATIVTALSVFLVDLPADEPFRSALARGLLASLALAFGYATTVATAYVMRRPPTQSR